MILSCNTIQDILPLVAEDLASEDTVKLVNEHLKNCSKCRDEYKELKTPKIDPKGKDELEAIPLKNVRRKLKNRNIYIGILTALIVALVLFVTFDKVTKPIPLSYEKAIESTEIEGGKLFIEFKPEVSNYSILGGYSRADYEIMAWKTNISRLFERKESKTTVISIDEESPVLVRYISQDRELDKLIYGKVEGGILTLPRLAMNYYFLLAGIICLIFTFLSLLYKNNNNIYKITIPVMILALSYVVSHIIILGISGITHHIIRDLFFVSVTTVLIFIIIILLVYRDKIIKMKDNVGK